MVKTRRDIKREVGPELGGLYIPMGIFFGLGVGIFMGGSYVAPLLFLGMGTGFLLMMNSMKRRHRKIVKLEQLEQMKLEQVKEQVSLPKSIKRVLSTTPPEEEHPTYLESTMKNYRESLEKITVMAEKIPNEKRQTVSDIVVLLKKIYEYVDSDISRYSSTKVFFQTYISSLENIIQTYVMLLDQPIKNESAVESIKNIEKMLSEMKSEFEESYVRLYEKDVMNVNMEMQMLRDKFKEEKAPKLF